MENHNGNRAGKQTVSRRLAIAVAAVILCLAFSPARTEAQLFGFKRETYYSPISLTLLDLKFGVVSFNYKGVSNQMVQGGASKPTQLAIAYSLDIAKFNFVRYFFRQSIVDIQTGLGMNYYISYIFNTLPSSYTQPTTDFIGTATLSPRIGEVYLSETFNYTTGGRLLLYTQASLGYVTAEVYRSEEGSTYLTGNTMSIGAALGLKFFLRSRESSRVGVGVEFRYTDARLRNLDDPEGIAPFTEIDLSNYGMTLNVGMYFGGRRTAGDEADDLFDDGRYMEARSLYTEFIRLYPKHSRVQRARRRITVCDRYIPSELYKHALEFQEDNSYERALKQYERVDRLNTWDFALSEEVKSRKREIARVYFDKGLEKHAEWDFDAAEEWLMKAELIDSSLAEMVKNTTAEVYVSRAERLAEEGEIRKAEDMLTRALEMNPELEEKVREIYELIAAAYYAEGVEALNRNAHIYAKDSFERAAKYNKEMRQKADVQISYIMDAIMSEKISEARERHEGRVEEKRKHMADRMVEGIEKSRVYRLWGIPDFKYFVMDGPVRYELWVYEAGYRKYSYLYFKQDRLHSWEKAEF